MSIFDIIRPEITIAPPETLSIGDLVCFDEDGRLRKWISGEDRPCVGAIPAGTKFLDNCIELPAWWWEQAQARRRA